MPVYQVTAPDGRKLKLTGDSPPTDKDLDEVFASLPPVEKSGKLFTEADPGIVGGAVKDAVAGFVPGGKDLMTAFSPDATPQEKLNVALKSPMQRVGEWGGEIAKGIAGIPVRAGLTLSDFLGGTKSLDVPIIGPQQSYQETGRQLENAGAGQVVSKALPTIQVLMDFLMGKAALKGGASLLKGKQPVATAPTAPEAAPVTETTSPTTPKPAGYYGKQFAMNQPSAPATPTEPLMLPSGQKPIQAKAPLSMEALSEAAGGWQPGTKVIFDTALLKKDIPTITKMLSSVPEAYKQKFAAEINGIVGQNVVSGRAFTQPQAPSELTLMLEKFLKKKQVKDIRGQVMDQAMQEAGINTEGVAVPQKPVGGTEPPKVLPQYSQETPMVAPKPAVEPGKPSTGTPTNQELAMRYLESSRKLRQKSIEEVTTADHAANDSYDQILQKIASGDKNESFKTKVSSFIKEMNPWRKETGHIEAFGPEGQELVVRGRRAAHTGIATVADMNKEVAVSGIKNLTPEEQLNLRDVVEGKATPSTPAVNNAATTLRSLFDKYGTETGVEKIADYWPRGLNEAGKKWLSLPQNQESIISAIMQERGLNRTEALKIFSGGQRRGMFEYGRVLDNIPKEFRMNPLDELVRWETDVARRIGIIKNFGTKNEIANDLIARIGVGSKYEKNMKLDAQTFVDRVQGKIDNTSSMDPVYSFLKSAMVVSKINPITSVANTLQGHVNSWLDYGMKGLKDATFGKDGNTLIKDLGITNLKGKISDEIDATSFTTKWMKAMGMEASEQGNYSRASSASYGAINRAWEALKKDPSDALAKKTLRTHAMFPTDAELAQALKSGSIPDYEMKMGILEGVRRKIFFNSPGERPAWANTGFGSTAYIFHSYILNQMELLAKAPPARQIAYLAVIAPISGLPILFLRNVIKGLPAMATGEESLQDQIPQDMLQLYLEASQSGPGTPVDIGKNLTTPAFLQNWLLGGFSPLAETATAVTKSPEAVAKAAVRGFVPMGGMLSNWMFPKKQ